MGALLVSSRLIETAFESLVLCTPSCVLPPLCSDTMSALTVTGILLSCNPPTCWVFSLTLEKKELNLPDDYLVVGQWAWESLPKPPRNVGFFFWGDPRIETALLLPHLSFTLVHTGQTSPTL